MTSAISIQVRVLISTKVTNLSTGPDGKIYLKVMHNWSVCVMSGLNQLILKTFALSSQKFLSHSLP